MGSVWAVSLSTICSRLPTAQGPGGRGIADRPLSAARRHLRIDRLAQPAGLYVLHRTREDIISPKNQRNMVTFVL